MPNFQKSVYFYSKITLIDLMHNLSLVKVVRVVLLPSPGDLGGPMSNSMAAVSCLNFAFTLHGQDSPIC